MKDIVRQIKRHWKVLTALCVAATVTVIGMVMLFASEIVVTVTASEEKTEWLKTDAAPVLTAAVTSLPDGVTVSSETITWSSSNSDAVSVSSIPAFSLSPPDAQTRSHLRDTSRRFRL